MHYIISDTHFGHENIKTYEPVRKDYDDERLVQLWNETITPEDEVLHLGDFAFKSHGWEMAKRLNGNITLLQGNHDFKKGRNALRELGFVRIIESIEINLPNHARIIQVLQKEFSKELLKKCVCLVEQYNQEVILFSHYPAFYEDPYDRSEEVVEIKNVLQRVFELSGCTCNYHGHIHSKRASDSRCINVSVEHCGFKPIPLRWS